MALSALDDQSEVPSSAVVATVLGPSMNAWEHLVSRMIETYGATAEEWTYSGAKYGWNAKLRKKKRTILYLIPQEGTFLVGLVLGDRALELLRHDELSGATAALIDGAPRYGEGTGFRVPVATVADCDEIESIVAAKMS